MSVFNNVEFWTPKTAFCAIVLALNIDKLIRILQYFNIFFLILRFNQKIIQCSVVEAALVKNQDVLDCAAFANYCPFNGEVPAAWVVLKEGVSYNEARLVFIIIIFNGSLDLLWYFLDWN